jgi:hypothetical protein
MASMAEKGHVREGRGGIWMEGYEALDVNYPSSR